uniref:Uncharacterized protein n=1 Tax=Aegilops tauschii subsp. strangulata TaxID=200361 RepID=A0A453D9P7_AEGTS
MILWYEYQMTLNLNSRKGINKYLLHYIIFYISFNILEKS